jgi:DNA repair exonuclease SbcCD ATPase subunit
MMSGAESRLFIFLFVMALLPLIPSDRRMNTLILDEPDSNMDEATLEVFTSSLLPRLAKVVPCLIVISPRDYAPNQANIYTVVKENGASRLVSGRYKSAP